VRTVEANALPSAVEQTDLRRCARLGAMHAQRPLEHHEGRRVALGDRQVCPLGACEAEVPHVDGRAGVDGALGSRALASDDAHDSMITREGLGGNLATHNALVPRRRHLVFGGQIHPELHHCEHTAAPREVATMQLFVDNTRGGGHPRHIARTNVPPATRGVPCSTAPA
jgi:hypothetical protein